MGFDGRGSRLPGWARGLGRCSGFGVPTGDERATGAAVEVAEFHRLGAGEEDFGDGLRAGGSRKLSAEGIDIHDRDAVGRGEGLDAAVFAVAVGALHEFGPNGEGSLGALEREFLVVVEADPHDAKELGGEAREPCVVGCAGFAGCREQEAAGPHAGAGSRAEDFLHEVDNHVGDTRVEDGARNGPVFEDQGAVGGADFADEIALNPDALIGEDGVGGSDVERSDLVRAESESGRGLHAAEPGGFGERGDVFIAGHFGELDGGNIEGLGEGEAEGDRAVELLAEIVGRVFAVVIEERSRFVDDLGDGRDDGFASLEGGIEGGGVDEGLEGGAGLAAGEGAVELAGGVAATAHEGLDFGGVRIEANERDLGLGVFAAHLRQKRVDLLDADADGLDGVALEFHVEGGVNAVGVGLEVEVGEVFLEFVVGEVDEVGGVSGFFAAFSEAQRSFDGLEVLEFGDVAVFAHEAEDDVAALDGAFGVAVGVEIVGALDEAGEEGGFLKAKIAEVLAEIDLGGLAEAVDGEALALAEVDLVGVVLEDLLLGELLFELEGDEGLERLAFPCLVAGEPEEAGELHGDGGGAVAAVLGDVDPGGAEDADGVEAGVVEEALVFGGDDGVNEDLGDVFEADEAAFFAAAVVEVGDEFGLEEVARALGVVAAGDDACDGVVLNEDDAGLGVGVGVHAGEDLDAVGADVVPADAVGAIGGVAAAAERGDELVRGEGVADADGLGGGEELGGLGERAFLEFLVDESGVMDPDGDEGDEGGYGEECDESSEDPAECAAGEEGWEGFSGLGGHEIGFRIRTVSILA